MKLKIGGVPEHFNLPWHLAKEEGSLQDAGITMHWEDMTGGTGQMIRGLENGTIDAAVLLTEGITKAILQGLDAKIIQVYVTSPLFWGIHVPYSDDSIQKVADLENKTFAISRKGSGSELMAYVLADREGWDIDQLQFKSIGDIYGGLWALQNNAAQGFLWETFTTKPHTDKKDCRFIGEVKTPWPSFVFVTRTSVIEQYEASLNKLIHIVNQKTFELKNNDKANEIIAWRYGLKEEDVETWINRTEWNYSGKSYRDSFKTVIDYLLKLKLITKEETIDYEKKLFHKEESELVEQP